MISNSMKRSTELQKRGSIEDLSYFSMKSYVVTPPKNFLNEIILMMGHKIYFMDKYG